ncbi:uncharacterized protein M421DRAFT_182368 [Didymella exigua CBS 183.55]|uniref:RGS domain-containing protein n=1 Tax=Didymella exigua CBS 183.55 TaxID=1150837 RepID=A0A6A5RJ56_9PLEO|nr:uncharacterized protein M421DRAFT_182368 [Didymella exigua CBS 183.55]KAF1927138.1 hypothetical protein M421DRAFT_182368 [Didymella exigua CBS 183.55]
MGRMAPILTPRMLNGGRSNTDALGITYVVIAIIYTLILAFELTLLYRRRDAFCVHIRNIKIVFAAVSMLHVYLTLVLLAYPWNGLYPCSAEFWVMSVFLPLGMAFFQACNARVLTAYESQRRMTRNFLEGARKERMSFTPAGLCRAWMHLDAASKIYVLTLMGLIISFVPALVLYFGSRRFHASYGFFGTVAGFVECRKGFEWIPSIFVQLFWTAMVGPWILWKVRHVQDVHSWAWQTRLAIIAGLPGTPLWIAFTYSNIPEVIRIRKYFAPAGWFIPSLIICQQVLILIPLAGAFKSKPRQRRMSQATETASLTSTVSDSSEKSVQELFRDLKPKASMQALELSIEQNIEPLIVWAATREFTAENAIFLREVRNWRKKWSSLKVVSTSQRRQMYNEASLIYFTLINPFTAETPINIEYKIFKVLQNLFAGMEYDPYMPRSQTPDDVKSPVVRENVICPWEETLSRPASIKSDITSSSTSSTSSIIPSEFTEDVFDAAYESIKYLIFTNTWPRYVDAEMCSKASSP